MTVEQSQCLPTSSITRIETQSIFDCFLSFILVFVDKVNNQVLHTQSFWTLGRNTLSPTRILRVVF